MPFLVLLLLFLDQTYAQDVDPSVDFSKKWERVRNFSCLDNPKYKAHSKFNRLFTLINSLEMESPSLGCHKSDELASDLSDIKVPKSLRGKIQFAKDLQLQATENSLLQMTYLYYRIYDENKPSSSENIRLRNLAGSMTALVYGGYNRKTFNYLKSKSQSYIDLLLEKGVIRTSSKEHAEVFNKKIRKHNKLLSDNNESHYANFYNYKKQYHKDLASDVGLLLATENLTERMGGDVYREESLECHKPHYSHKMGMSFGNKEEKCFYPEREADIRGKDINRSLLDLRKNFYHATKNHDQLDLYESKLKSPSKNGLASVEMQVDEFLGDKLVYSPRSFAQVLAKNMNYMEHVCQAFDYAFNREGDEHIETKLLNGIEFFGPASMWIMAVGAMPFLKGEKVANSHKLAIKGIMGVTALDLVWRAKNIHSINEDRKKYEHELLSGNADLFTLEEFERLKEQYVEDKKGLIIAGTYEALSLVAIGRIAKLVSKSGVHKLLTKPKHVDELLHFARFNKQAMSSLKKKGITNNKSLVNYLSKASEKDRMKFADEIMSVRFGANQLLTAGIALKELADTHYFMYSFPYVPQGISATGL